ncbi:MAG: hypothetical protein JNM24_12075 [Bdellovibrionaceae bacterium]|nr:hypothetical protein [Pseudobdellovibrionaceae bacterium]
MKFAKLATLNINEINELKSSKVEASDGDKLLTWAASQNISFLEEKFTVLGKDLFRFQGSIEQDGINFYSFGRSAGRKLAAIKSTAEIIERLVFNEFTKQAIPLNLNIEIKDGQYEIQKSDSPTVIESSFFNSNGWAVDFSVEKAIDRALREAIERHLLILTFAKYRWDGFFEINQTQMTDYQFRSVVSKISLAGFSAGMALCQSPRYNGISLGYLADSTNRIATSEKWEQAFYESFDLIRVKESNPAAQMQKDLIGRELEYYLNAPFEHSFTDEGQIVELKKELYSNLAVIDLKKFLNLPVPFFAAVVHSGDLLPLYFTDSLTVDGKKHIKNLCEKWELSELPERHPIL